MAGRSVPTQFSSQYCYRVGKSRGGARPRLGPGESPPHASRTGGIRLVAGGTAVSSVTFVSKDRATPAPYVRCTPSDTAAYRPHIAAIDLSAGRCERSDIAPSPSTFVTVWAFNPSCFLMSVSMSISIHSFGLQPSDPKGDSSVPSSTARASRQSMSLASRGAKFGWGVALDTAKTVASDPTKAEVRGIYQKLMESSGWKPTSISPAEFLASVKGSLAAAVRSRLRYQTQC